MDRTQAAGRIEETFAGLSNGYRPGALDFLLSSYAEPHRAYHNEKHIAEILGLLEKFSASATRPDLIRHATLWHDVVYKTQDEQGAYRQDKYNVQESIVCFQEFAPDMPQSDSDAVCALIKTTDGHALPASDEGFYPGFKQDAGLFLDFDLYQFAKPWEAFQQNTKDIRQEFAWVPTTAFCQARADVLDNFAKRDPLYFSVSDRAQWQENARVNLQRSASELRQGVLPQ